MSQGKFSFTPTLFYVIIFTFFSCQKKEKTYFETIAINDVQLSATPKPGSWRYNHDEKFQQFDDFQKAKKIKPEPAKNTIYLQPIGNFNKLQQKKRLSLQKNT